MSPRTRCPGKRDIAFRRSVLQSAIAVYDRIDYIKVTPDSALAHLGSEKHPKGYQQFEAVALSARRGRQVSHRG